MSTAMKPSATSASRSSSVHVEVVVRDEAPVDCTSPSGEGRYSVARRLVDDDLRDRRCRRPCSGPSRPRCRRPSRDRPPSASSRRSVASAASRCRCRSCRDQLDRARPHRSTARRRRAAARAPSPAAANSDGIGANRPTRAGRSRVAHPSIMTRERLHVWWNLAGREAIAMSASLEPIAVSTRSLLVLHILAAIVGLGP